MSNIIQFPSESQRDEMEFKTMKEFEYKKLEVLDIYLHWGKDRGLRAEICPIIDDKVIIKINEDGDRAWIYIKDWYGKEFKYVIKPEFCLLISDDVNQLLGKDGMYPTYYRHIKYVFYMHTNKTINHDKNYIEYVKKEYLRRCEEEEYFIENKNDVICMVRDSLIFEKFD